MKTRIILLTSALLAFPVLAEPPTKSAAPTPTSNPYAQGMAAVAAGDPVTAETCFLRALQLNPNDANATYQLKEVQRNAASIAAKGRANKFGAVVIPKLNLDQATLEESLALVSKLVTTNSKETVSPNFVIDDPQSKFRGKTITLQLNNIPAKAVLEYILSQVGGKARFDEHAIVISPR